MGKYSALSEILTGGRAGARKAVKQTGKTLTDLKIKNASKIVDVFDVPANALKLKDIGSLDAFYRKLETLNANQAEILFARLSPEVRQAIDPMELPVTHRDSFKRTDPYQRMKAHKAKNAARLAEVWPGEIGDTEVKVDGKFTTPGKIAGAAAAGAAAVPFLGAHREQRLEAEAGMKLRKSRTSTAENFVKGRLYPSLENAQTRYLAEGGILPDSNYDIFAENTNDPNAKRNQGAIKFDDLPFGLKQEVLNKGMAKDFWTSDKFKNISKEELASGLPSQRTINSLMSKETPEKATDVLRKQVAAKSSGITAPAPAPRVIDKSTTGYTPPYERSDWPGMEQPRRRTMTAPSAPVSSAQFENLSGIKPTTQQVAPSLVNTMRQQVQQKQMPGFQPVTPSFASESEMVQQPQQMPSRKQEFDRMYDEARQTMNTDELESYGMQLHNEYYGKV